MNGYLLDTNVMSETDQVAPEPRVLAFLSEHQDLWLPAIVMYELESVCKSCPKAGDGSS